MSSERYKHIIIGAGLSGLVTAYELHKKGEQDFIVLEGRDRIGGRILTSDDVDLGATWFQNHHETLSNLIDELGIPKFHQYNAGKSIFIYSSMAPAQYFENDPNTPSAYRIGGGSSALINKLATYHSNQINLNEKVGSIDYSGEFIKVNTSSASYEASKIVIAMPPQMTTGITMHPALPAPLQDAMTNTHTWMSNAIKVGIRYATPFWREKKLSGTIIGHVSPVIELYDHSNIEDNSYSLMGFMNEGLREDSQHDRKERILSYLEKHFGPEVRNYISYQDKDWSMDPYTSCEKLKSIYISPRYGNPIFQQDHFNGRIILSGAETSPVHGGYMDGAVVSGIKAAKRILDPV